MPFVVSTTTGLVRGFEKDNMLQYLGIPYAQTPVGALRLKRAVPKKPWEGVLDATAHGPASIQPSREGPIGSEDCLTVNIRTPLHGEKLPVLVFIHGGGYNTGTAANPLIEGSSFVRDGIVYVTFQYRLNVWGFFDFDAYPQGREFDTNRGLSDHIVAMKWIHDNIAAFGGDPENITISGESAGAISVVTMLAVPELKGTFQKAISSSALPNACFSREMNKRNMDLFLQGMGWTAEDIPQLKTVDAYEVQKGNDYMAKRHQYENPGIFLPANRIDDLLPRRPIEAIAAGAGAGVKLMIGTNLHEGSMFVRKEDTNFPNSWEMIEEMFRRHGYADRFPAVKAYYEQFREESFHGIEGSFIHFATDYAFQYPSLQVALGQSRFEDVYMYRFQYISESMRKFGMMCDHAMDLPCDFDTMDHGMAKFAYGQDPQEQREKLFAEVHGAWVNFVKTGDPGWEKFNEQTNMVHLYDKETKTIPLPRAEMRKIWDGLEFYR